MKYFVSLTLFLIIQVARGQSSLEIDLAKNKPGNIIKSTISPMTLERIIVKNRLIGRGAEYEYSIESVRKITPPFEWAEGQAHPSGKCKELNDLTDSLTKISEDEALIGPVIEKLREMINSSEYLGCPDQIEKAKAFIDSTTDLITLPEPIHISSAHDLKIVVKRKSKIWTFVYTTETEDHWSVLYGFTYIPNLMNPITTYYANKDTGSTYLITPSNGQRKDALKNITPTVMYSWHPIQKYSFLSPQDWLRSLFSNDLYQVGFTAGVSLNLSVPTAMVGPSILVSDNVSLNGGVVMTQKDVLAGKYKTGQRITENLDFDQLHEKQWMAEWFVSIAYRFDKNPFSSSDKKDEVKKE